MPCSEIGASKIAGTGSEPAFPTAYPDTISLAARHRRTTGARGKEPGKSHRRFANDSSTDRICAHSVCSQHLVPLSNLYSRRGVSGSGQWKRGQSRVSQDSRPHRTCVELLDRHRWRTWVTRGRTLSNQEPCKARRPTRHGRAPWPPTKTFSPFGKTPIPTSPSIKRRKLSTRSCNSAFGITAILPLLP